MIREMLLRLGGIGDILERTGDVVVPRAGILAHDPDIIIAVWWYNYDEDKLYLKRGVAYHKDGTFPTKGGKGWIRGRVFKYDDKNVLIVYVHDMPTGRISIGILLKIIDQTQADLSDISLDLVVEEEGHSLV